MLPRDEKGEDGSNDFEDAECIRGNDGLVMGGPQKQSMLTARRTFDT